MISAKSIRVTEAWQLEREDEFVAHYRNEYGDALSINYFPTVPDIEAGLDDLPGLRMFYRRSAEIHGVALVEADVLSLHGLKAVRTIMKARLDPRGFAFLGSYTLPFADRSFVLKLQSLEQGVTGIREATVMAMDGNPRIDEATGKIIGWEQDPYDPGYQASFMRNKADDSQYDASFPDHPLSKVRRYLAQLSGCVEIAPDLKSLPAFGFKPRGSGKKPWWKFGTSA
jgi:hypothetical protein